MNAQIDRLLAEVFRMPVTAMTDDLTMRDVPAWDSLTHMELVAALERSFGIELSFEEIIAMQSVGQIKRVLHARKAG